MKKYQMLLRVADASHPAEGYTLLRLTDEKKALPEMLPGQFVQVRASRDGGMPMLRRPISINYVDLSRNELWLLVHDVGEGTHFICSLKRGDTADVVLPLGRGFSLPKKGEGKIKTELLAGGGVGTAPLLFLGKELVKRGVCPTFLLGGRRAADILEKNEFAALGPVYLTTEDGSAGEKGFVTDHSILSREKFDLIATCGPKPMMISVARYARRTDTPCEASLENLMACGLGACLCCVEQNNEGHNVCVCTEGPVFNINQLSWPI